MRGLVALLAALSCAAPAGRAAAPGGALSSNAIKGPPPGAAAEASAAPAPPFDGSNKAPPAATRQVGESTDGAAGHRERSGTQRGWRGHSGDGNDGTQPEWRWGHIWDEGWDVGDEDAHTHREME